MRKRLVSVVALVLAAACFLCSCTGGALTKVTGTVIEENFDGSTEI